MLLAFIEGELFSHVDGRMVIATTTPNGCVAYEIIVGDLQLCPRGPNRVALACWDIGGDDPKTFGFATLDDRRFAQEIYARCHGIGPTMAHKAVTALGCLTLARMIQEDDEAGIRKAVKGLGTAKAADLIDGMKPHLHKFGDQLVGADASANRLLADSVNTLKQLGFSDADVGTKVRALIQDVMAGKHPGVRLVISDVVSLFLQRARAS